MKKTIQTYIADKPLQSMPGRYVPVPVRKGKAGLEKIIREMKYDLPSMAPVTIRGVIETFNRVMHIPHFDYRTTPVSNSSNWGIKTVEISLYEISEQFSSQMQRIRALQC